MSRMFWVPLEIGDLENVDTDTAAPSDGQLLGFNASTGLWVPTSPSASSSPLTTKGDVYTHDGSVDARLPVGSDGQVLTADAAVSTGLRWSTPSSSGGNGLWRHDIDVFGPLKASVGAGWARARSTSFIKNGILWNNGGGSAAQNDRADWNVSPDAGTWDLFVMYGKDLNGAILTFQLDDGAGSFTTLGTIDSYVASGTADHFASITGVSVGSSIRRTLRVIAATKNPSSSGFVIRLQSLHLQRTA